MAVMKCLVLGGSGSAGSYLCEYLTRLGHEVIGTGRNPRVHLHPDFILLDNKDDNTVYLSYRLVNCDLTIWQDTIEVLERNRPDYIFNLAANADVRGSFDRPLEVLDNNIKSTAHLLEAIRQLKHFDGYDPIIQHCSTSEVYGIISQDDCPVSETYPLKPVNVYAVSKLTQEQLALAYHKMYGLKVIVTRAFGYINPRRHNIFSTAFAKQIVEIERGKKEYLEHGNLDSVRTLMDVRDVSRAYWYAATKGRVGEIYNIGSTQPISVKEFLDILVNKVQEKRKQEANPLEVRAWQNPDLMRPIDVTLQIPDTRKFLSETGFHCEYTLDESINWLLEECRKSSG
jgi:GDP-4-dehydro-6-deoxy-D-mannose reductase